MSIPKTIIEIVDPMKNPDENTLIKPHEVRVNGVPVSVAKDGINIEYDRHDHPVRVTLEILPDQLIFRRAKPYRSVAEQYREQTEGRKALRDFAERENQ